VLGPDVVVAQAQRLTQRQLEDLLRTRGERDLAGGDLLARADDPHDLGANALDGDVKRLEDAGRQPFLLAQQAEQDVLGPDVVVLERASLLLGEDDHLAGSLCESLEHGGEGNLPAGLALAARSMRGPWKRKPPHLVHPCLRHEGRNG
jgi:hypothetical protein